jgi:hypothetical protein
VDVPPWRMRTSAGRDAASGVPVRRQAAAGVEGLRDRAYVCWGERIRTSNRLIQRLRSVLSHMRSDLSTKHDGERSHIDTGSDDLSASVPLWAVRPPLQGDRRAHAGPRRWRREQPPAGSGGAAGSGERGPAGAGWAPEVLSPPST